MTTETILADLQTIFRSVLKKETLLLSRDTVQGDIENWDSLHHAVLIDTIEKKYDIKFDLMDMISIQNVGDICNKVASKKIP